MRKPLWAIVILSCACALATPALGVPLSPPAVGDPEIGRALFSGTARFRNDGAACLACHAISGMPGGGSTLGPDLTQIYADYGEEGIAPVLAGFPFPSMKPIYDARPITPEEQAHLKAFLRISSEREPEREGGEFLLFGIGGAVLLTGVAHVVWRKRLSEVRRPLLKKDGGAGRG